MKLVRDKIPDIIRESGNSCEFEVVKTNREFVVWLKAKMDEEAQEFLQNPCIEEAADMYEVLISMIDLYGIEPHEVIKFAEKKRLERGSFLEGILLK